MAVAGGLKEGSGEEKVDQMLGEIELRVGRGTRKTGINSVGNKAADQA